MKPVRLIEFVKALLDKGVDIQGCRIEDGEKKSSHYYLFKRMSSDGVSVLYGADHDLTGTMTRSLLIDSVGFEDYRPNKLVNGISNRLVIRYKSSVKPGRI